MFLLVLVYPCSFMLLFAVFSTAGLAYFCSYISDFACIPALNVFPTAFFGISEVAGVFLLLMVFLLLLAFLLFWRSFR
jgi:hypothetical protein